MRSDILDLKDAKRIAIMGGTFDPVHYGHLVTAEAVRHEYNIDCIIFIPTGKPPHKLEYNVTHSEHRYLMTVLATYNNPCFNVSRMEIEREGMTYTIDTIKEIRKLCRDDAKIYFITGADAVHQILTWKDSQELLGLCSFIAVTRPGYNSAKLYEEVEKIKNHNKSRIHFFEVPALAISSSDIRNRLLLRKPIKYLLPEEVEKYITKFKLYSAPLEYDFYLSSLKKYESDLKKRLTDKRFIHSLGVVEEAAKLAEHYGADKEKVMIAALLHDCAKCYIDDDILEMCGEYGIPLDNVMRKRPIIAHGILGAEVAKREFDISDQEVLGAIKYHTTGKADMSLIEKIIYLPDCIEPNREPYPGLEQIRKYAYSDLDMALKKALINTINENKEKKRLIHKLSYEALEYLLEKESEKKNDKR